MHGVEGSALTLELTESSLMVDPEVAKKTMRHLAELGVSVAIDDFGTGYSSLAYLTDLPIGELKIDKSFVRAMGSDARNAIVVRSTIELAHNLGPAHGRRGDRGRVHVRAAARARLRARPGLPHEQAASRRRPGELVGRAHARRARAPPEPVSVPRALPAAERGLMLLVLTAIALVISVPLAGGRLSRLADIQHPRGLGGAARRGDPGRDLRRGARAAATGCTPR